MILFAIFAKYLLDRQDKKEAALTAMYLSQLKEQREEHEKEYAAAVLRAEAVMAKLLEVVSSSGEAMRGLKQTVETFSNLRGIEEQIRQLTEGKGERSGK